MCVRVSADLQRTFPFTNPERETITSSHITASLGRSSIGKHRRVLLACGSLSGNRTHRHTQTDAVSQPIDIWRCRYLFLSVHTLLRPTTDRQHKINTHPIRHRAKNASTHGAHTHIYTVHTHRQNHLREQTVSVCAACACVYVSVPQTCAYFRQAGKMCGARLPPPKMLHADAVLVACVVHQQGRGKETGNNMYMEYKCHNWRRSNNPFIRSTIINVFMRTNCHGLSVWDFSFFYCGDSFCLLFAWLRHGNNILDLARIPPVCDSRAMWY